jgi:hypothetical protein
MAIQKGDMQTLRRLLKVFEFSLNLSSWDVIRPRITINAPYSNS